MIFKIGEEVVDEVVVNIPGCNDIIKFSLDRSLTSLEYNYLAELRTSTGFVTEKATAQLMSPQAVRVLVVETTGDKVASAAPDWFGDEVTCDPAYTNAALSRRVDAQRNLPRKIALYYRINDLDDGLLC